MEGVRVKQHPSVQGAPLSPSSPEKENRERAEQRHAGKISCKEGEKELFPGKKPNLGLPEKGSQGVDFDKNVWSSSQRKPPIAPEFTPVQQDPLAGIPQVGGYYVAQIVGQTYDLHLLVQEKQFELFKATSAGVQKLRDDQIELIRKEIRSGQIETYWSYWSNLLEYFGIATSLGVGAAVFSSGNAPMGAQLVMGSALSLAGKILTQCTESAYVGRGTQGLGALIFLYGTAKNPEAVFNQGLPRIFAKSTEVFQQLSQLVVAHKQAQAQASKFTHQARKVKNDFQRQEKEKEMERIVGGLGKKDQANVIAAAAKAIYTESEIVGQIARGR